MINISIDQAKIITESLHKELIYINRVIRSSNNRDEMIRYLAKEKKISMLIKDIEYKLSNEILNS